MLAPVDWRLSFFLGVDSNSISYSGIEEQIPGQMSQAQYLSPRGECQNPDLSVSENLSM